VNGTQDNACGPRGGGACENCAARGEICEARQCIEECGPTTCPDGCCRADNTCARGIADNACGSGGVACANCNTTGSFCNRLVSPRRCNDQQSTCPAAYGACPLGVSTPVTPARQRVCSDASLSTLTAACAGGPDTQACVRAVGALSATCRGCLAPFNEPFSGSAGLYACAASFVSAPCRRATGCATDCAERSCRQCASTSEDQCVALVNEIGGQCMTYALIANCARSALDPGELCSQFSYAHFGEWLRSVGDHFCGNGP
jgi:hypothetical protein